MKNLLNKIQIVQFIIIMALYILSSYKKDEMILDKDSKYYKFLLNIVKYNNITKQFVKKNNKAINYIEQYKLLLESNDYFYIFYNNNIYTYFFKEKDSDSHIIYFNGINNINDIKIIIKTVIDIFKSNFNFDNIETLLNKKGLLYKIENEHVEINNNRYSVIEVFDYLYENIYSKNESIHISINGFSLGGPISQLFTLLLLEKYENKIKIDIYNIESWFGGNKDLYNQIKDKTNITNIYNQKSLFYFFNIYFQKYFKSNLLINNENGNDEIEYINYNINLFPLGIINYGIDNHLLSKILSHI